MTSEEEQAFIAAQLSNDDLDLKVNFGSWVNWRYCTLHGWLRSSGEGEPITFPVCAECERTRESRPPVEGSGGRL